MSKDKKLVISLLIVVMLMAITPIFVLKDAEFGGSDDAGSVMIESIQEGYEPWFTPVLENSIGGELPGEVESLFFCLQTAIGVGVLAFCMGRMYERKKLGKEEEDL
ncbi:MULTISPECIES: energy-coupling factor ABC transporter substrate-binding protein [Fusobacterium]|uniref:energy-coupling factor ABC transporter substrate-binding protein n=1 Tax=Fusobacterium TaxID=848 RepID=UPI001F43CA3C|nr:MULTISPECIES: energy-coupling factor ABC transporter substrate-binding protein [Fusobacterium]MCF2611992.1 energy-coupling factor ABC transporter substrate-binding protein [Fusobacterium perfoetens]MDY2980015.1 energy-coupling factor ABC transporter substrate-binding protein [Fusobacterium sp.]